MYRKNSLITPDLLPTREVLLDIKPADSSGDATPITLD
jgi:hypothetical protein